MRIAVAFAALAVSLGATQPVLADDVATQIENAHGTYAKGDALHTLAALQSAVSLLESRLSDQFAKAMPAPLPGWEAAQPASQSLDTIGGGLTVTRAYSKGDATLNASLVVDNPAVGATVSMFRNAAQLVSQPGWSRVKVNGEDAILRYDASSHSGEISLLVADRALLEIEGNDIAKDDVLIEAAKGWNVAGVRKLLGP